MKKSYLVAMGISLAFISCNNEPAAPQFQLNGTISNVTDSVIYLGTFIDREFVASDSTAVTDNTFSFSGSVVLPEVKYVQLKGMNITQAVFVENTDMTITGDANNPKEIKVSGSASQELTNNLNAALAKYYEKQRTIASLFREAKSNELLDSVVVLTLAYDEIDAAKNEFLKEILKSNTQNVFGLNLLSSYLLSQFDVEGLKEELGAFPDSLNTSIYYELIDKRIVLLESTKTGAKAPLFTQNDVEGNPVSLADFQGNYVLIDFWASWCGPCRQENPNVVSAYAKYHELGFQILGVSLDENGDRWKQAIAKDQLTWPQVSDLKGWNNAVAKLYGITGIPHSILLDPNGVIVAKNLREEVLHEKLAEIYTETGK